MKCFVTQIILFFSNSSKSNFKFLVTPIMLTYNIAILKIQIYFCFTLSVLMYSMRCFKYSKLFISQCRFNVNHMRSFTWIFSRPLVRIQIPKFLINLLIRLFLFFIYNFSYRRCRWRLISPFWKYRNSYSRIPLQKATTSHGWPRRST